MLVLTPAQRGFAGHMSEWSLACRGTTPMGQIRWSMAIPSVVSPGAYLISPLPSECESATLDGGALERLGRSSS
jgi:hypothetical protein